MTRTTTATVGQVIDRQVVVPAWLDELATYMGSDQPVIVEERVTPFGTFLTSVVPFVPDAPDAHLDDLGE